MTTKTDFHSIMELKENFKPKERGWIDQEEAAQVKKVLELDGRTDIELQNIRDMAVMLYGQWSSSSPAACALCSPSVWKWRGNTSRTPTS